MTAWYVWTKRDTGRGGWEFEPEASSPTDPALDSVIETLASNDGFPQLEPLTTALPSTEAVPIVSAVWEDTLGRWAFILRGRGGPFGAAGATQVCLGPVGQPIAYLWPNLHAGIGPDGIAQERTLNATRQVPPTREPHAVLAILRAVARGAGYYSLDVGPTEAFDLIGATLPFLPDGVARGCCWSTLHVARRSVRPVVIGGLWPEALRQAWDTKYRRLTRDEAPTPETLSGDDDELLDWWVGCRDYGIAARSSARTMADFLMELRQVRPLELEQVRRLVTSGRLTLTHTSRIMRQPNLVRALVEEEPETGWLVSAASDDLPDARPLTARLLLTETPLAVERRQELRRQVLSGTAQRALPLVQALDQVRRLELVHLILDDSRGQDTELAAARGWLRELHITPQDAPDLFGFDPAAVAALARTDPDAALVQLGGGEQKWGRLRQVIRRVGLDTTSATLLAASVTDDPRLGASALAEFPATADRVMHFADVLARVIDGHDDQFPVRGRVATALCRWASEADVVDPDGGVAASLLQLATGIAREGFVIERVPPRATPPVRSTEPGRVDDGTERLPPGPPDRPPKRLHDAEGVASKRWPVVTEVPTQNLPDTGDGRTKRSPRLREDDHGRVALGRAKGIVGWIWARRWVRAGLAVAVLIGVVIFIVLTSGAFT